MQRSAGNAAVTELLRARPGVQRATSADEIAAGSAATRVTSPEARPVLARGARGPAVATLQAALAATTDMPLTADGEYGPQTAARVCLIQRYLALKVDGIVGPDMWRALDVLGEPFADDARDGASGEGAPSAASPTSGSAPTEQSAVQREEADETSGDLPARTLTAGSVSPEVFAIQTGLMLAYPGAGMVVDGSFGVQTLAFVLLYQVDHGLTPDGIVGPETRKHLDLVESFTRKAEAMKELSAFQSDLAGADVQDLITLGTIPPAIVRDIKTLGEKDF